MTVMCAIAGAMTAILFVFWLWLTYRLWKDGVFTPIDYTRSNIVDPGPGDSPCGPPWEPGDKTAVKGSVDDNSNSQV